VNPHSLRPLAAVRDEIGVAKLREELLASRIAAHGRDRYGHYHPIPAEYWLPSDISDRTLQRSGQWHHPVAKSRQLLGFGLPLVCDVFVAPNELHAPGRRPGSLSPKDQFCREALAILDNDAERPRKGYGRLIAIARSVLERLGSKYKYNLNSIEKNIRGTVREWEEKHPDK
jgi:hypothetical protein